MSDQREETFAEHLAELGAASLTALHALEVTFRRMGPMGFEALRQGMTPVRERLSDALAALGELAPPDGLAGLRDQLSAGAALSLASLEGAMAPQPERILGAMHDHARAQAALYPLRGVFPPLGRFYAEPARWDDLASLDAEPRGEARVGIHNAPGKDADGRGGFVFYVPEHWDGEARWPLVVALHGGGGHGSDFLWTWLREARSRGFFLLSPTSRGSTWSFMAPEVDGQAIAKMIDFVSERWPVDRERVLLTGLSDGATFTLQTGLAPETPYTALAPLSGVLHPITHVNGQLASAAGKRIYLVHGAMDWMFPIDSARETHATLAAAGAQILFREIEDLSHAYAREQNAQILNWFDPSLELPDPPAEAD
jgi:phospholipase/carboxylesterase